MESLRISSVLSIYLLIVLHQYLSHAKPLHRAVNPEKFLEKFGYLKTRNHHDKPSMLRAVKMYQHMMALKETGDLDLDTMDMMEQPRCGVADMNPEGDSITTPSILISINGEKLRQPLNFYAAGYKWSKYRLTWRISRPSIKLSYGSQRRAFYEAFQLWSDVSPLEFVETSEEPDINILFAVGEHGDGPFNSFDGRGGILAHAFYPEDGKVHFDESEDWSEYTQSGTNLMVVAAHEIGHALGLGHSNVRGALMWPTYQGYESNYKLPYDDIRGIQYLYGGPPRTPFTDATTTTTKSTTAKSTTTKSTTTKSTTTTCEPCPTNSQPGTPEVPDGCTTKFDAVIQGYDHRIYMFRGEWVWRATDLNGVDPGFPKLISEVYDFDPPINFGSAVYSPSTYYTYIFKGNKIWKYWGQQLSDTKTVINPRWPTNPQVSFTDSQGTIYIFYEYGYYIFDEDTMDIAKYNIGRIEERFPGIPYNVEAAVRLQDGYIYFFKGNKYRKYDDNTRRVLDGYPKLLAPAWVGPQCGNGTFIPK